jgi:hypothetical protein
MVEEKNIYFLNKNIYYQLELLTSMADLQKMDFDGSCPMRHNEVLR